MYPFTYFQTRLEGKKNQWDSNTELGTRYCSILLLMNYEEQNNYNFIVEPFFIQNVHYSDLGYFKADVRNSVGSHFRIQNIYW